MQDGDSGLGRTKPDGRCRNDVTACKRPVARDSLTLQSRRCCRASSATPALTDGDVGLARPAAGFDRRDKNIYTRVANINQAHKKIYIYPHCACPARIASSTRETRAGLACAAHGVTKSRGNGRQVLVTPCTIGATQALVQCTSYKKIVCTK